MPRWQIFLIFFLMVFGPIIVQVIFAILDPSSVPAHSDIGDGSLWSNG